MPGKEGVETAVEAMKAGAFDYIMKPVRLDDLKEKIEVYAKHLLDAIQKESPYYPLVEKILNGSKKRI